MRALLFSSGVAVVLLLLAGCEEVMDKPSPAPMTDTAPSFSKTVADQAYLVEEIVSLTLPHATGGDGPLTYSLAPEIPGLMFDAATRTLSGAPTAAGAYDMTYQAADADDNTAASDAATLTFTITVQEPPKDLDGSDLLTGAWTCVEDLNLESLKTTNTGTHPVGCRLLDGGAIQFNADGTGWDLKQYQK